jgi:hypothetical protein
VARWRDALWSEAVPAECVEAVLALAEVCAGADGTAEAAEAASDLWFLLFLRPPPAAVVAGLSSAAWADVLNAAAAATRSQNPWLRVAARCLGLAVLDHAYAEALLVAWEAAAPRFRLPADLAGALSADPADPTDPADPVAAIALLALQRPDARNAHRSDMPLWASAALAAAAAARLPSPADYAAALACAADCARRPTHSSLSAHPAPASADAAALRSAERRSAAQGRVVTVMRRKSKDIRVSDAALQDLRGALDPLNDVAWPDVAAFALAALPHDVRQQVLRAAGPGACATLRLL